MPPPQTENQARKRNNDSNRQAGAPNYGEFTLPFGIFDVGAVNSCISVCGSKWLNILVNLQTTWNDRRGHIIGPVMVVVIKAVSEIQSLGLDNRLGKLLYLINYK